MGTSSRPHELACLSATEFLEANPRPAFILDLQNKSDERGLLKCSFVNSTLRSSHEITQQLEQGSPSIAADAFWAWASKSLVSEPNESSCYQHAGITWTRSMIRDRWSIVSGSSTTEQRQRFSLKTAPAPSHSHQEALVSNGVRGRNKEENLSEKHYGVAPSGVPLNLQSFEWPFLETVDWSKTLLGPMDTWSLRLKQAYAFLMTDPRPASLIWGPDNILIYNKRYYDVVGDKHPGAFCQKFQDAWPEIPEFPLLIQSVRSTAKSVQTDDTPFYIRRSPLLEEVYFTISLIPVFDGTEVTAVFNPVQEKTTQCIAERRMTTLLGLTEITAGARSMNSFWGSVLETLNSSEHDLPFGIVHTVTLSPYEDVSDTASQASEGSRYATASIKQIVLEGHYGLPEDHECLVETMDFSASEGLIPFYKQAARSGIPIFANTDDRSTFGSKFAGIACRPFQDECKIVVICPIKPSLGSENVCAFVVLGLNPRRPYDNEYQQFIFLLNRMLSTGTAATILLEEEIEKGKKFEEDLALTADKAQRSEMKFTRFADNAPIGINVFDAEGRILYANDIWYDVTRHDPKDETPMGWMHCFEFEESVNVEEMWEQLAVEKQPVTFECRLKKHWLPPANDLEKQEVQPYTWVLCSAYPQLLPDGSVEAIVGCFMNISQQKWAEELQRRRVEEAMEAKRMQESFIDMTSHEMRNPLSAIIHCADGIISSLRGDPQAALSHTYLTNEDITGSLEAANTIVHCANHQRRIVDDILTFSKLDSGLLPVTPERVYIVPLIEDTLKMFESEVNVAHMDLKLIVESSIEGLKAEWVQVDPSRLTQIFINLLSNAIKFTQSEPTRKICVRVGASISPPTPTMLGVRFVDSNLPRMQNKPKSPMPSFDLSMPSPFHPQGKDESKDDPNTLFLHFAVEDTGRGLSSAEMQTLFQRFSQASPRTHVKYGGSGLGLFISRELTALQGGEIGASSISGKGSTFAFYVKSRRAALPKSLLRTNEAVANTRGAADDSTQTNAHTASLTQANPVIPIRTSAPGQNGVRNRFPVLIVEDNLINRRVLSRQLRQQGFTILEANHGQEALDILQKSKVWSRENSRSDDIDITVILMDIEMPVMNGLDCTRRIRELEANGTLLRHIPTIATTANARKEQIDTALAAGMDSVISKPYRVPQLIEQMEKLVVDQLQPS